MQGHNAEATKGMAKHAGGQGFTLTFLMSSEVMGFPFLSIAPSATMMMLRRDPRVLVWSRARKKAVHGVKRRGEKVDHPWSRVRDLAQGQEKAPVPH